MSGKRLLFVSLLSLLLLSLLSVGAKSASAHTLSPSHPRSARVHHDYVICVDAPSPQLCDDTDPLQTDTAGHSCYDDATLAGNTDAAGAAIQDTSGGTIGYVWLLFSPTCQTNWAEVDTALGGANFAQVYRCAPGQTDCLDFYDATYYSEGATQQSVGTLESPMVYAPNVAAQAIGCVIGPDSQNYCATTPAI